MEQNLNLYQIFYEAAKCRSFSTAARRMYVSQPAVSKAVARLEECLGALLFHRSPRGVSLTPEGELLYRHVEEALHTLHNGEELIRAAASQGVSRLSIGVSTTLCKYVLLPLLKGFMAENPRIKITISCQSTFETLSALQKGETDIGLVGIPSDSPPEKKEGIAYIPLKPIQDVFVAADSYLIPFLHRFKGELCRNEDFIQEAGFILPDKANISRMHADSFLQAHELQLSNIIEVSNMDLSIEFARAGLGIAFVISDFVQNDIKNGILREVKLGHRIPKREIGFACPADTPISGATSRLVQYCQSSFFM